MARTQTKMIEIMKFDVNTTQADIDNGECRLANRCMEKVAIGRALGVETKGDASHVRVDANQVRQS
jgi:hypothetical protein